MSIITDKMVEDAFDSRFDGADNFEIVRELLTAEAQLKLAKDRGDLLLKRSAEADKEYQEIIEDLKSAYRAVKGRIALHRWIPVDERLPRLSDGYSISRDGTVDVWALDNKGRASMGNFYPKMQVWNGFGFGDDDVTHWKPILLPPDKDLTSKDE